MLKTIRVVALCVGAYAMLASVAIPLWGADQ